MPIELMCPTCHVSLEEKQAIEQTWTVKLCPHCQSLIQQRMSDHDSWNAALVAATALMQVATRLLGNRR